MAVTGKSRNAFRLAGGNTVNDPSDSAERTQAPDDRQLLAWLGEAVREAEPPPAQAIELAQGSFILRALDAELAALIEDSDLEGSSGVAVRDLARPKLRQLSFQFYDAQNDDEFVVAMEVETRGPRRRLSGHLSSQGPAELVIRQPGAPEARQVEVDHLGRFVIEDVLPGPMSLTCRRPGARPVATEWTRL
jgi:hypothetical protein